MMDAAALVAAAIQSGQDPFSGALAMLPVVERVNRHLEEREQSIKFVGTIVSVDRIRTEYPPGKLHIVYQPDKPGKYTDADGTENIDTDWLSGEVAALIEQTASRAIGRRCLFYKLNAEDPTGDVSQGFRRVIWIEPLPGKADDSPRPAVQAPRETRGGTAGPSVKQVELAKKLCGELCYPQDKKKWLPAYGVDGKLEDLTRDEISELIDLLVGLQKGTESPPAGWMRTMSGQYMVQDEQSEAF